MVYNGHPYSRPIVPNLQDPAAVDFRAFYQYTPNEVKHRKRTTNQQLKVLESIFKKDTKPNAQLRQDLAAELGMTPRGVQVWFQNRRAKEKTRAVKNAKTPLAGGPSGANEDEPSSPLSSSSPTPVGDDTSFAGLTAREVDSDQTNDHRGLNSLSSTSAGVHSSSHVPSPPQLHVRTDSSTLRSESPFEGPPDSATSFASMSIPSSTAVPPPSALHNARFGSLASDSLYSLRRGSLPVLPSTPACGPQHFPRPDLESFDPLVRRGSVDASLQRLASNPFAPLARAKNSALYGAGVGVAVPGISPSSGPIHTGTGASTRYHPVHSRMPNGYYPLQRRNGASTMPTAGPVHHSAQQHSGNMRRFSMDARATRIASTQRTYHSASPSPLTPYNAVRASLPEPHLYSVVARPIVSPIPGPLPISDYSFGAASSASPSSVDSERNSPDSPKSLSFGGEEDGQTSPSYGSYSSRFGSIASVATSESSITSSYYAGPRGSVTDHAEQHESSCLPVYSDVESRNHMQHCGPVNPLPIDGLAIGGYSELDNFDISAQPSYPSPPSTISAGGSPSHLTANHSSALAFALDGQHHEQKTSQTTQDTFANFSTVGHSVTHTHAQDHIQQRHHDTYFTQSGQTYQQEPSSYSQTYSFGTNHHLNATPPQDDYSVFAPNGEFSDPIGNSSVLDNSHLNVEAFVAYT